VIIKNEEDLCDESERSERTSSARSAILIVRTQSRRLRRNIGRFGRWTKEHKDSLSLAASATLAGLISSAMISLFLGMLLVGIGVPLFIALPVIWAIVFFLSYQAAKLISPSLFALYESETNSAVTQDQPTKLFSVS
jgi:hypothetical protein